MLNVPNFLTLLRIGALPGFLILLSEHRYLGALALFVAAGITDALDGAVARLTNSKTTLGAYMDPLADKLLLLSAFIVLAFMEAVPPWLTVIVISRDVIIVVGYFMLFVITQRRMAVRPSAAGKVSTCLQLAAVAVTLLRLDDPDVVAASVQLGVFGGSAAVTAASGLQYVYRGLAWLQAEGREEGGAPGHRAAEGGQERGDSAAADAAVRVRKAGGD